MTGCQQTDMEKAVGTVGYRYSLYFWKKEMRRRVINVSWWVWKVSHLEGRL